MKYRRLTVTCGLLAALSLGVAGCQTPTTGSPVAGGGAAPAASTGGDAADPAASPSATAPEDAREALRAAAAKLGEDTSRVEMTTGKVMRMSGVMDPKAKAARMTTEVTAGQKIKIDMIMIGADIYLKFNGKAAAGLGKKWLHLDATKLPNGSSYDITEDGDPGGATRMLRGVTTVERVGTRDFKGVLDLTKAPNVNKSTLKTLGDKATKVPFTAAVDEQGRLVTLTIDTKSLMPQMGTMRMRYSDFGTPVDVRKPAADTVTEAPDALTGTLNA